MHVVNCFLNVAEVYSIVPVGRLELYAAHAAPVDHDEIEVVRFAVSLDTHTVIIRAVSAYAWE